MRPGSLALTAIGTFLIAAVLFVTTSVLIAWTGPTSAPPNGNVAAPLNVGTTDQIKDAGLALNSLAVFGGAYIQDRLGIANVSPAYPLDVTGDIHNTGNMYSAGYFHNSDARLKENVQPIDGLNLISRLRGVSFNWKASGEKSTGVIAQEVEDVMPEAVHTMKDGTKAVEYDQIIAALIEAVKAQQGEIEKLKAEGEPPK